MFLRVIPFIEGIEQEVQQVTLKRGGGKAWLPTGLLPLGLSLNLATLSCMILGKNLHVTKRQFSSVNKDHSTV